MTINFWKVSLFLYSFFFVGGLGSAQCQILTFQPKADYSTDTIPSGGSLPYAVAVGDLNNDGYPDIVTVNSNNNNISVFLNHGNNGTDPLGTFAPAVNYSIGNSPHSLVLADLNGDGKLDVAAANYATSTVAVRLGNGNGTFQSSTAYSVGLSPNAIAVGDVNNDGRLDLITGNGANGTGSLSYLRNNGSGTFDAAVPLTADSTTGLVLADFDGDGNLDIASTSNGATTQRITVRYGLGDGTFGEQRFFALPTGGGYAIRTADVDGDKFLDLLTANTGNGAIGTYSYRQGDGMGDFPAGTDTALGFIPFALEIADLNGDGFPDLLFANSAQSEVAITMGNGDGSFQAPQGFSTGSQTYSVAVGDFNKDGKPDVVTANFGSNSISVLINATPVTARTISGRILLEATNSSAVPITFTFQPQDGSPIFIRTVTPDGNGDYTINNIAPKVYNVGIKGTKWLKKSLTANAAASNVVGLNAILLGGDANNDNVVDIGDLTLLIAHYNQSQGGGNYLDTVDFNNDGASDIIDLNILISHYNRLGDP